MKTGKCQLNGPSQNRPNVICQFKESTQPSENVICGDFSWLQVLWAVLALLDVEGNSTATAVKTACKTASGSLVQAFWDWKAWKVTVL